MAAVSRCTAGHLHIMASGRTTSFVALVGPKRLAVGEGRPDRCPGDICQARTPSAARAASRLFRA